MEIQPPTERCICGGRFRLDVQYLIDAQRFSLKDIPDPWRCTMCGRSLTNQRRPHAGRGSWEPARAERQDPCGESLLDEIAARPGPRPQPPLPRPGREPGQRQDRDRPSAPRSPAVKFTRTIAGSR
jgi:hypothetical protein